MWLCRAESCSCRGPPGGHWRLLATGAGGWQGARVAIGQHEVDIAEERKGGRSAGRLLVCMEAAGGEDGGRALI